MERYWIASTLDGEQTHGAECTSYGDVCVFTNGVASCALRPVVCLPATVTGEKGTGNIWSID